MLLHQLHSPPRSVLPLRTAVCMPACFQHGMAGILCQAPSSFLRNGFGTFYQQLVEAVGSKRVWAHTLNQALGRVYPPHHEARGLTPLEARGAATLDLYRATVDLLRRSLDGEHWPVIEAVLGVMRQAGC
jgi:hypothetical protein